MSEENVNLSWVREVNSWVEAYNYLNDKYALRHALMALLVGVTRELCYEIEKLPPGEQQTKVSVIAADLSREIKSIVDLKRGSETVYPSSEIVLAYRKARMDLEFPEEERGLTQRAPDACPYCAGKGEFVNVIGKALRCNHCAGTGQRG